MAECAALVEWAETTGTPPTPVSSHAFGKHMEYLSALPSKNIDDDLGRKSATVYYVLLKDYSAEAIAHMVREACRTLDWFPTPKQCLELVATYRAPPTEQDQALLICRQFAEEQFNQWMENIRNSQPIGDVPDRWKRIAVERGAMRLLSDGSYVSRALYQGPSKLVPSVHRRDIATLDGPAE